MAGLAKGRPQVHPNAALSTLPQRLRPIIIPGGTARPPAYWPGLPPPPPGDATYLMDYDQRVHRILTGGLDDALYRLRRINTSIRDLIRQHESAWMALRLLYNAVVILEKLLERLRDMFRYLGQVESVAKEVNVYEGREVEEVNLPDSVGDGKRSTAKYPPKLSPRAWSSRTLPKVEPMLVDMRSCFSEAETACRAAVLRRPSRLMPDPDAVPLRWHDSFIYNTARKLSSYQQQVESHMLTCKFIHMVSTEALYAHEIHVLDYQDSNNYNHPHVTVRIKDQPAFYNFWSEMDLATAAKRHYNKHKKGKKGKAEKKTQKSKDGKGKSTKEQQEAKDKDRVNNQPQATASKEDLLAAIERKDYLTVVTLLMSDMTLNDMLDDGTFLLSHAVDDDNAALVSILAMCGADPNVRHRSGNTPLHFAAFANCTASALLLLELGAVVDARDVHGLTPLHVACRERNSSIVLQLLAHGADPNACDNRGLTPFAYALLNYKKAVPSRDILTVLFTYGARTTGRDLVLHPFIEAILQYNSTVLCSYLKSHPEVVEVEMPVATTGAADSGIVRIRPLFVAVLVGNIFAMDQLLRKGADVHHVTTAYGKTITYLSLAVQADSASIVSRLLLQHADPNIANNHGRTPLHLAVASPRGELEVAKQLLRHGADYLAATHDRHSQALHMAVRVGRADMCDLLLKKGAPIDRPLRSGVTPLMLAVYHNNKTMMRFLMSKGANVAYATPIYGETAMHTASRVGNIAMAAILLGEGLSVNAVVPFPPPRTSASVALSSMSSSSTSQSGSGTDSSFNSENMHDGSDTDSNTDSNDTVDEEDLHRTKVSSRRNSTDTTVTATTTTATTTETTSTTPANRSVCGYAPIHAAASRGHVEMVRWLLANGADPEARIGRTAANMCLGKDRLKGKGKDKASSGFASPSVDDADDESDLGETPVDVARFFGHDRTAAILQDAILEASPALTQFQTALPPRPTAEPSSSSSSSSSGPPPLFGPPPGPPPRPHSLSSSGEKHLSQYSLEANSDSTDEGDAMMEELHRSKRKQPPSPLEIGESSSQSSSQG
ncbi:hypothetical protein SEUCBS140593_007938 [Sporothrix eucalyptigena]|uniref:Ankyrin repeat protein n=1 Tax=Sporothrix eucalyptigena TaxID=1812306 RepID=A0ABP0CK77_9PEZI